MRITENASLIGLNSFRIDVQCQKLIFLEDEKDLPILFSDFLAQNFQNQIPLLILGGGSNCLFTRDFEGIILQVGMKGIRHTREESFIRVNVMAGEKWNDLVNYCLDHQIGGLENLSLIPGTVGAAPVQNIGAYGVELKDYFYKLRAFHLPTGKFQEFSQSQCAFDYRDSIFKKKSGEFLITQVEFHFPIIPKLKLDYGSIQTELNLAGINHPNIRDIGNLVSKIRILKLPDPSEVGNAGSFFKNPIISFTELKRLKSEYADIVFFKWKSEEYKLAAGWLIEQCGWKGKSSGKVGTWKNQALVIVNHGGASGKDILNFSESIIDSVFKKFGVKLIPEVNIF